MRQLPRNGETFLDHVAHFVPSMDGAEAALERLGFALTPFTAQQNRTAAGLVPAGTANRCAMFRQGYVEILARVLDTELSRRLEQAVARYTGVHLIALSVDEVEAAHERLGAAGFAPEPPVDLTRPVQDAEGRTVEARFSVLRVPPKAMPEGRIQLLKHHTEDIVWQERWLKHPNGIESLEAVLLTVADAQEASERFGRFSGRVPTRVSAGHWILSLDRGALAFVEPLAMDRVVPGLRVQSHVPSVAGYAVGSGDPDRTRECFAAAGLEGAGSAPETSYVLPPELGGFIAITRPGAPVSWASER